MGRLRWPGGRRWLVGALVALAVFSGVGAVRAAPDKREVEARADFAAGRYQQAIDLFAQLYGETLNPIYLRNIGRCQQNLNQPQAAINAFREYLRKEKGMTAGEREEIEGYIKEMEALLASHPAAPPPAPVALPAGAPSASTATPTPTTSTPPPAASTPPPGQTGAPAGASPESPAVAVRSAALAPANLPPATGPGAGSVLAISAPPPASHVEHPWRTAGIVTAAAGGATIVTGVILGLSARSDANAVGVQYDPSQADAGKRNGRLGIAADIVGAAAVVTGVLLATHEINVTSPSTVSLRAGAATDLRSGLLLLRGTF